MLYILHFETPLAHAQHYLGYVADERRLQERLEEHANGRGARLMEVVTERLISWSVARTMPGDKGRERALKNNANTRAYCPICQGRKRFQPYYEQLTKGALPLEAG